MAGGGTKKGAAPRRINTSVRMPRRPAPYTASPQKAVYDAVAVAPLLSVTVKVTVW